MRQGAKKKDDSVEARRERNRQAQHAFRKRRHASEEAQRSRIQRLERTVEELSNVLVGLCDDMLGTEEIARQPRLMARLHRSTAQALALTTSTSDTTENRETGDNGRHMDQFPTKRQNQRVGDANLPQIAPPVKQQAWHQDADSSFPLRLVKTTVSRACLYLNGDVCIAAADLERAFGSSLRLHTRQQLLAHLQWLLGPGKDEMHQATGINWSTTSDGSSSSSSTDEEDLGSEFLTALGVQEHLQSLGVNVLGSDMMELSINGYESLQLGTADLGPTILPAYAPSSAGSSAALIVWLNTSLLTSNLAYVATCLGKGPVYPRRGVARAVEASVIMARGG